MKANPYAFRAKLRVWSKWGPLHGLSLAIRRPPITLPTRRVTTDSVGHRKRGDSGDQVGLAVGDGLAIWLGDAVAAAVAVEVSRKFNWLAKSVANVPYTLSVVAYIKPM